MPRRKLIAQKQRRRRAYRPGGVSADASVVKPRGAFRIFTNYRLFAIIGATTLVAGFAFSAYGGTTHSGPGSSHGSSTLGQGVTRATPEAESAAQNRSPIKQHLTAPAPAIDPSRKYVATIKTEKGDIVAELLASEAPATVNNFVFLARDGFYDGVIFNRVIADRAGALHFAQAGDPAGTGSGGPGYDLPVEQTHEPIVAGVLAMAKRNEAGAPNNGSQFFITLRDEPTFDGKFTVFGRVTSGLDVLRSLEPRNPQLQKVPSVGTRIEAITITES